MNSWEKGHSKDTSLSHVYVKVYVYVYMYMYIYTLVGKGHSEDTSLSHVYVYVCICTYIHWWEKVLQRYVSYTHTQKIQKKQKLT